MRQCGVTEKIKNLGKTCSVKNLTEQGPTDWPQATKASWKGSTSVGRNPFERTANGTMEYSKRGWSRASRTDAISNNNRVITAISWSTAYGCAFTGRRVVARCCRRERV